MRGFNFFLFVRKGVVMKMKSMIILATEIGVLMNIKEEEMTEYDIGIDENTGLLIIFIL